MKLVILAAVLFAGTLAQARTYESNLETINLDKNLRFEFGNVDVYGGTIALDYTRKEARLTLYRRMDCPARTICAAVMPPPIVIKLPIKSQKTDSCGIKVITANNHNHLLAGPILPNQKLVTVVDNRGNKCPTFVALPETEVELHTGYNVTEPMFFRVTTHSTMTGDRLKRTDDQL